MSDLECAAMAIAWQMMQYEKTGAPKGTRKWFPRHIYSKSEGWELVNCENGCVIANMRPKRRK